jgi:hypothetical protein
VDRGCAQQADTCTRDRYMAALQDTGSVAGMSATRRW